MAQDSDSPAQLTDKEAYIGISSEEVKFVNLIRVLLDAGWCLDEASFMQVLVISGAHDRIIQLKRDMKKMREEMIEIKQK